MLLCPVLESARADNAYTITVEYFEPLFCLCYIQTTFLDQSPERSIIKIVYMA